MSFTKKDFRLIYELDCNYRNSYTSIARKLKMSEQLVSHKVQQFIRQGIVNSFCPVIDYSRFGLFTYYVFFKVYYQSESQFRSVLDTLGSHEGIIGVIECDGKYDVIAVFASANPSAFNKNMRALVAEHDSLRVRMILTTVVEHIYPRSYLVSRENNTDIVVGGDREEKIFSTLDLALLLSLVKGNRKLVDLAAGSNLSSKTTLTHLRALEKEDVIRGYRLVLQLRDLGVATNMVLLQFRSMTIGQDDEFRSFCKYHPCVIEFVKTLGEWDALLYIETKDRGQFRAFLLQLREKFDAVIEDTDNFRVFTFHKKQYLPLDVFKYRDSS